MYIILCEVPNQRPNCNLLCSQFTNPKALNSYLTSLFFLIIGFFEIFLENFLTFSIPPFQLLMEDLTGNLVAASVLISWDKDKWKLQIDRLWLPMRKKSSKLCRAGLNYPVLSRVPAMRAPRKGCPQSGVQRAQHLPWSQSKLSEVTKCTHTIQS